MLHILHTVIFTFISNSERLHATRLFSVFRHRNLTRMHICSYSPVLEFLHAFINWKYHTLLSVHPLYKIVKMWSEALTTLPVAMMFYCFIIFEVKCYINRKCGSVKTMPNHKSTCLFSFSLYSFSGLTYTDSIKQLLLYSFTRFVVISQSHGNNQFSRSWLSEAVVPRIYIYIISKQPISMEDFV